MTRPLLSLPLSLILIFCILCCGVFADDDDDVCRGVTPCACTCPTSKNCNSRLTTTCVPDKTCTYPGRIGSSYLVNPCFGACNSLTFELVGRTYTTCAALGITTRTCDATQYSYKVCNLGSYYPLATVQFRNYSQVLTPLGPTVTVSNKNFGVSFLNPAPDGGSYLVYTRTASSNSGLSNCVYNGYRCCSCFTFTYATLGRDPAEFTTSIVLHDASDQWDSFANYQPSLCGCTTGCTQFCPSGYNGTNCATCANGVASTGCQWYCTPVGSATNPVTYTLTSICTGQTVPAGSFVQRAGYVDAQGFTRNCTCGAVTYSCPSSCSGHGTCNYQNGTCTCAPGWTGAACDQCTVKSIGDTCGTGACPLCGNSLACDQNGKCCRPVCGACGSDGCSADPNICGTCAAPRVCQSGTCVCPSDLCTTEKKLCGTSTCGQACGTCPAYNDCLSNGTWTLCQCNATKACSAVGQVCGASSCPGGASCGTCTGVNNVCSNGQCICVPNCAGKDCGPSNCPGQFCQNGIVTTTNYTCANLVNNICNSTQKCQCIRTCSATGAVCGDDGCGGSCGTCTPSNYKCNSGSCVCVPNCTGKECGLSDGCGGSCGTCPSGTFCNASSLCQCQTNCAGKLCHSSNGLIGDNLCGGVCGSLCTGQDLCVAGSGSTTSCVCQPLCTGKVCGANGCGGSCGSCASNELCIGGACVCQPNCPVGYCGDDGCGNACLSCPTYTNNSQTVCVSGTCTCIPQCTGKPCGADGCGGSCGSCPSNAFCNSSQLCQCVPACDQRLCHTASGSIGADGCGGTCGTLCSGQDVCQQLTGTSTACVCIPNCAGKQCGSDGCGGSCGACPTQYSCNASSLCQCNPLCTDKSCNNGAGIGGDGCGGYCGTACPNPNICSSFSNGSTGCLFVCNTLTQCDGRSCGTGACGGNCGSCPGDLVLVNTFCNSSFACDCAPNCAGKQCGNFNGCGGSCGTCGAGQVCDSSGQCVCDQLNECNGRDCGSGRCGGSCGTCTGATPIITNSFCNSSFQCDCAPNCAGKQCGVDVDGCGGSCGTCPSGYECLGGACVCVSSCPSGAQCGFDSCGRNSTFCGVCPTGVQWDCNSTQLCECTAQCAGKTCGSDSCGGSCGSCGSGTVCGAAQTCVCDVANECVGRQCGIGRCGGNCGVCNVTLGNEYCNAGTCDCRIDCSGAVCGSDGCGGSCGTCGTGLMCSGGVCVCAPDCPAWAECGDSGCEGEPCGAGSSCGLGKFCSTNYTCECLPDCFAKSCGDDGCGGTCGTCDVLDTCTSSGICLCGSDCPNATNSCQIDRCGQRCGVCVAGEYCSPYPENLCLCQPSCLGKVCGDDGCGGNCGDCVLGSNCTLGQCVCTPECPIDAECGLDVCGVINCGNNSGACPSGYFCQKNTCYEIIQPYVPPSNDTNLTNSTFVGIPCPGSCSGNGLCDDTTGVCTCASGYIGLDCAARVPVALVCGDLLDCSTCSGNSSCSWCQQTSPAYCSLVSYCLSPARTCDAIVQPYEPPPCPDDCNNATSQGYCSGTECICSDGYSGVNCGNQDNALTTIIAASSISAVVVVFIVLAILLALGIIGGTAYWKLRDREVTDVKNNEMFDDPMEDNELFDEEEEAEDDGSAGGDDGS